MNHTSRRRVSERVWNVRGLGSSWHLGITHRCFVVEVCRGDILWPRGTLEGLAGYNKHTTSSTPAWTGDSLEHICFIEKNGIGHHKPTPWRHNNLDHHYHHEMSKGGSTRTPTRRRYVRSTQRNTAWRIPRRHQPTTATLKVQAQPTYPSNKQKKTVQTATAASSPALRAASSHARAPNPAGTPAHPQTAAYKPGWQVRPIPPPSP